MSHHKKTQELLEAAKSILEASESPMTVRQTYYQLVTKNLIENCKESYSKISRILGDGRKEGEIAWELIEDRVRTPWKVNTWDCLTNYFETVKRAYRKDLWEKQNSYIEVSVEKDALSGIFSDVLSYYQVTLNVGRGYDSLSSLKNMADRLIAQKEAGKTCYILSFGDFDPSGEDIFRALYQGLENFRSPATCKRCAILQEDITNYNLPPNVAKSSDARYSGFINKNGSCDAVELDALPGNILKQRIKDEVEACIIDKKSWDESITEQKEQTKWMQTNIQKIINKLK